MKRVFYLFLSVILFFLVVTPAHAAEEGKGMISDAKPSNVKASGYNYNKIRISWDAMENADGYTVYRASSENGTYKKVYTTDNVKKTWYINTNRKTGQTWWYKVRGYQIIDGKKVFSKYSKPDSAYARPNRVKVTDVDCSGFIYRTLDLNWKSVVGATGYQVYMKERGEEKFRFMGNFKGTSASIDLLDTTKIYDLKIRAYTTVDGKKVKGYFSEVFSYEFDWSEESLLTTCEEYIRSQWPNTTFDSTLSTGEEKTPYNGTSWLAVWPKRFCLYEPWEEVKAELIAAINTDVKMQGDMPQEVCFYVMPDNDENWVTVYLLN